MNALFPFKPPSVAIDAIEVEFDVFFGYFKTFDSKSLDITFLFSLSYFVNYFLNKLETFDFELRLNFICRERTVQSIFCEEVVEDPIIRLQIELDLTVL